MHIIGIIAEYNPFHNGHAYQIAEIKRRTHADYIIAVMSGDFVQRGAPAIAEKSVRTRMALSCGADLVLELPVLWATASAEDFAMAGITALEKAGCVDGICFGAETDDLPLLSSIADFLADEPKAFRESLTSLLKQGYSFPKARELALKECFDTADAVSFPNNILALEYLKAIRRRNSALTPYLIRREGLGYHDTTPSEAGTKEMSSMDDASMDAIGFLSATAIRHAIFQSKGDGQGQAMADMADCTVLPHAMPEAAASLLQAYLSTHAPLCEDDFSQILGFELLRMTPDALAFIRDCSTPLANRILNNRFHFTSYSQFCSLNKSREVTYSRISRVLLATLLGITDADAALGKSLDYIPYLRILGFRKESAALVSHLKQSASVAVIAGPADARLLVPGCDRPDTPRTDDARLLALDFHAAELYRQVCAVRTARIPCSMETQSSMETQKAMGKNGCTPLHDAVGASEYTQQLVIV